MMNIESKFIFHPVGFGLFYSGNIRIYNSNIQEFNFVFDCGSKNKKHINNHISTSKIMNNIRNRTLDFLSISHFHKDHISGIPTLLNHVNKINNVIIPYLTPIERLSYALSVAYDNNDPNTSWLRSFYINPIKTLLSENKIENIILT